jgi:Mycoplasma protein of unknown function, DUF285
VWILYLLFFQFAGASSFNQNLSQWNVSSLLDATSMFVQAESFNQNLCTWRDVLPPTVLVDDMFTNSSCTVVSDPVVNGTSFCTPCST